LIASLVFFVRAVRFTLSLFLVQIALLVYFRSIIQGCSFFKRERANRSTLLFLQKANRSFCSICKGAKSKLLLASLFLVSIKELMSERANAQP